MELPKNLVETEKFTRSLLKEEVNLQEFSFESNQKLFESIVHNLEISRSSTSLYGAPDILERYKKLFYKSSIYLAYAQSFWVESVAIIVASVNNPTYLVKNGRYKVPDCDMNWHTVLAGNESITNAIKCVGRIEYINMFDKMPSWGGTGWLYGNNGIVVTNAHIATDFAGSAGEGRWVFKNNNKKPVQSYIDLIEEVDRDDEQLFRIDEILYVGSEADQNGNTADGRPDIAILKINSENDKLKIGLSIEDEVLTSDSPVVTIGYPIDKSRENGVAHPLEYYVKIKELFKGQHGVKRIAPGKVISYNENESVLQHDSSTLTGNSGSPIINPKTGKVAGIHYYGDPDYMYNLAYSSTKLKTIFSNLNL